jgi:uncharacterized protein (TIGR03067 family)
METISALVPAMLLMLANDPSLKLKEYQRLQGVWVVESANEIPLADDNDSAVGSTFTFEGRRLFISCRKRWFTVEIDPSATPKQIDLVRMVDDAGHTEAHLCIYDMTETQLRICFGGYREKSGYSFASRATDFANRNPRHATYVLRRQKQ